MADTSPLISGVAERYARSLFELARDGSAIDQIGGDLDSFEALIAESEDLRRLVVSPVFSADEQFRAISAIVDRAGLQTLTGNFLKVVAQNRRLFVLPGIIRSYRQFAAAHRGETTAEVTSAHALTSEQERELKSSLKAVTGKDVALNVTVDPAILGGLVVKVGSRQIDTSLRTKLSSLKLALKEVG